MILAAIDYPVTEETFVTPRGVPVTMAVRGVHEDEHQTNDHNTTFSCLDGDEYHLKGRHFEGIAFDIGGYTGGVSIALAVDNPGLHVIAVEPVPDNADLIERNAARNGVADRVTVYRGAVGPRGVTTSEIRYRYVGDFNLEHHAFVGNTSLAYPDGGEVQHETLTVETLGLGALMERFGEPSLLKIDCEGGEWPFFGGATINQLRKLPLIVGEAHPVGGHLVEDIERLLGKTHRVTTDGWLFEARR